MFSLVYSDKYNINCFQNVLIRRMRLKWKQSDHYCVLHFFRFTFQLAMCAQPIRLGSVKTATNIAMHGRFALF